MELTPNVNQLQSNLIRANLSLANNKSFEISLHLWYKGYLKINDLIHFFIIVLSN